MSNTITQTSTSTIPLSVSSDNSTESVDALQASQKATNAQQADISGVSSTKLADGSSHSITMPTPKLDAASLMLSLSTIQKEAADISAENIATAIKGQQSEIAKLNEKRAEEVKKYFENLEKASRSQKTGFFGLIAKFFKAVGQAIAEPSKADEIFAELNEIASNSLGEIFKDIISIAAMVAGAVITLMTAGASAPIIAALVVGGLASMASTIMSDPGIIDLILEGKSDEEKAKIQEGLMIASYVCMGVSLACSVTTIFVSGAKEAVTNPLLMKVLNTAIQLANSAFSAGVNINNSLDAKEVADLQAEAINYSAEADRSMAKITEIEQDLQTRMDLLRDLFAIQQNMVESTCNMLNQIASGNKAASAV